MSKERISLGFADNLDTVDFDELKNATLSGTHRRPKPEDTAMAAEKAGFKSREPMPLEATSANNQPNGRVRRQRRTGRNAQFNIKARPDVIEAYYAIADAHDWALGEALEYAVALLEEKYGKIP